MNEAQTQTLSNWILFSIIILLFVTILTASDIIKPLYSLIIMAIALFLTLFNEIHDSPNNKESLVHLSKQLAQNYLIALILLFGSYPVGYALMEMSQKGLFIRQSSVSSGMIAAYGVTVGAILGNQFGIKHKKSNGLFEMIFGSIVGFSIGMGVYFLIMLLGTQKHHAHNSYDFTPATEVEYEKKNNIIESLIFGVILGLIIGPIIADLIKDGVSFLNQILVAIVVGFIVGIIWLLGKKLLAYMNK